MAPSEDLGTQEKEQSNKLFCFLALLLTTRIILRPKRCYTYYENPKDDKADPSKLIREQLPLENLDCEGCCNHYYEASDHLVNTGCYLCEPCIKTSRSKTVQQRGNDKECIIDLFLSPFSLPQSKRPHGGINQAADHLTHEHQSRLYKGVLPFDTYGLTIDLYVRDYLILQLDNNRYS